MKQAIFGIMCGFIVILVIVAVMTVEGRSTRENEADNALSAAVDEVMENLLTKKDYDIENNEEFVADFCEALLEQIQAGSDEDYDKNLSVKVDVAGVDYEKGLLSVHVTEQFTHPNGNIGTLECTSTAILDQRAEKERYTVTYNLPNRLYKQLEVEEGTDFYLPKAPADTSDGAKFQYWMDTETGEKAVFPEKITGNKTYTAVFEMP